MQTGENRVYTSGSRVIKLDDGSIDAFYWEEGNGACDCNRAIFFYGPMQVERGQVACGSSRYFIRRIEALDDDSNIVAFQEPFDDPKDAS